MADDAKKAENSDPKIAKEGEKPGNMVFQSNSKGEGIQFNAFSKEKKT